MTYEIATIGLLILAGVLFITGFIVLIYAFTLVLRLQRETKRAAYRITRMRDINGRPYRERL